MHPDAYVEMAATESRHWWFVGRRAIVAAVIAQIGLPHPARILEVGCGTGGNLELLSRFGSVVAMEANAEARRMAIAKSGGRLDIRAGACPDAIPFGGAVFDLVCLFDVLEHIDDDAGTLRALKALLAPGGRIVLTVPAHRWLWSGHDEHLHHKRRYSARELRETIAAAGLAAERLSYYNALLFPLAAGARLVNRRDPSGTALPSAPVNALLAQIFAAERFLLPHMNLPFGVSLIAVLR